MTPSNQATGTQLRVDPEYFGIPYEKWILKAPLCNKRELEDWMRKMKEQPKPIAKKKQSGALPENAEWL